jgi:hypothetical protein
MLQPAWNIPLYIREIRSRACGLFRYPTPRHISRVGQVRDVILILMTSHRNLWHSSNHFTQRGCGCGRDPMVVGFTTTFAISVYHQWNCKFESRYGEAYSIQHYVINFCQWLATGQCFSPGTPVSMTNKTDCHDITGIMLKGELNALALIFISLTLHSGNMQNNRSHSYWLWSPRSQVLTWFIVYWHFLKC